MNARSFSFARDRFLQGLGIVLASVDNPDAQWVHQMIDTPKRKIEELNELVKTGALDLGVAEERLHGIERRAWPNIHRDVLVRWHTKDQLAQNVAKYRRAVSGDESQYSNVEEDIRRKEALRTFEEIWFEIVTWHQVIDESERLPS